MRAPSLRMLSLAGVVALATFAVGVPVSAQGPDGGAGARQPLKRVAGEILAVRDAFVSAEVDGRVILRPGQESRPVKAGEVVVRVDDRLYVASERRAAANVRAARARLDWARREYSRVKKLAERGSVGQSDLDRAEVGVLEAKAALGVAEASHEETRVRLDRTRIVAPFSGDLVRVYPEQGSYLRVGDRAFRIVDRSELKVVAFVPAHVVAQLKPGRDVAISASFESGAQTMRRARLVSVAAASTGTSRTYRIEVRLKDGIESLRPGMAAWIHFDPPLR